MTWNRNKHSLVPSPPFNFAHGGPNTSSDVTLDQHRCVHGDASIHHDIVPECPWSSSSLISSSETDGS